jgi:hypothetical protein
MCLLEYMFSVARRILDRLKDYTYVVMGLVVTLV